MVILASQSPRRRELLERAGIRVEVRPSGIEEIPDPHEPPQHYVKRLAVGKAAAVEANSADFVLAADTIVVVENLILEKPSSPGDARRMLGLLSGRNHTVLTGVCVRRNRSLWTAVEQTEVHFLDLSPADIEEYISSGEPTDKAGAYAIQGRASRFIDRIEGCYFNVVGLPVSRVWRMLREAGYRPDFG